MPYKEAMARYGSDKPDLRFGYELTDISDIVKNCGFGVFAAPVAAGGSVRLINIKGGAAAFPRKKIDKLVDFVKTYKAKGLAWARLHEGETASSFAKFMSPEEMDAIFKRAALTTVICFFDRGDENKRLVFAVLGARRCHCGPGKWAL